MKVPVTYLLGTADGVVPLHAAIDDVAAIPGARAMVLGGLGHLCAYEVPDVTVCELRPLLNGD